MKQSMHHSANDDTLTPNNWLLSKTSPNYKAFLRSPFNTTSLSTCIVFVIDEQLHKQNEFNNISEYLVFIKEILFYLLMLDNYWTLFLMKLRWNLTYILYYFDKNTLVHWWT